MLPCAYAFLDKETEATSDFFSGLILNHYFSEEVLQEILEAIKVYQSSDKLHIVYCIFLVVKAGFYYHQKDYEEAIEVYTNIIEANFRVGEAFNNRGVAYLDLGDVEAAINDYTQAINSNINCIEAYTNRGSAYFNLKKYQEALADFERVVQLDPYSAQSYFNRGLVKQKLNRIQEALMDFDMALKQDTQHIYSLFHCGWICTLLYGRFRGIQYFEKAKLSDHVKTLEYYYIFTEAIKNNLYELDKKNQEQIDLILILSTINWIGEILEA